MARHQPAAVAAMEGLFNTQRGAGIVLIGQPNEEQQTIDNPLVVNDLLSFLIYGTISAEVKGLDQVPRDQWPEPLALLFYSYHIMAGLGTYFALLMIVAGFYQWRGKLPTTRWVLWPLMLSFPLPYIANTAGWVTAEIGRQPWLVYGLIRTSEGYSRYVSEGEGSRAAALYLWPLSLVLTIASLPVSIVVRPDTLKNYLAHPVALVIPVAVIAALLGAIYFSRKWDDRKAFACSSLYLALMLLGAGVALYPRLLPSRSTADRDITIQNALSGPHTLQVGLMWWAFGICLAAIYFIVVYRMFKGKVSLGSAMGTDKLARPSGEALRTL
jgi:hypothetical protein